MATENLMMEGVRRGGDRQHLHERVRVHSHAAADAIKAGARSNDLLDRIAEDSDFNLDRETITRLADASAFTGLAPQQVERFLDEHVEPILHTDRDLITSHVSEVRV